MTYELEKLAEMARGIWSDDAVNSDDLCFVLGIDGETLTFFSPSDASGLVYCRAQVAPLDAETCPAGFAEAMLQGNFFWTGTRGGTLSFSESDGAIYLTDRFDVGTLENEGDFARYAAEFIRTVDDWRVRRSAYIDDALEDAGRGLV